MTILRATLGDSIIYWLLASLWSQRDLGSNFDSAPYLPWDVGGKLLKLSVSSPIIQSDRVDIIGLFKH